MQILVSFCNLRAPGLPALGVLDPATSVFRILRLPAVPLLTGITGLAMSARCVFAAVQGEAGEKNAGSLLVLDRRDLSLIEHYRFRLAADVHSLWFSEGVLYVVSTGTDEVLALGIGDSAVSSEEVFWRPERDAPRADNHHLNAICAHHGTLLVSAFGKRTGPKWSSANDGCIYELPSGEVIATGLDQPHSLAAADGAVAFCESRRRAVRILGAPERQELGGYTRGLSAMGQSLFVATSMGRRVSKSSGLINNPAELGDLEGACTVNRLSATTLGVEQTIDLSAYASEVYELLPIVPAPDWPSLPDIEWRDAAIQRLGTALDHRTVWARSTTEALARHEARISELGQQLATAENARARAIEEMRAEALELRHTVEEQARELDAIAGMISDRLRDSGFPSFEDLSAWGKRIEYGRLVRRLRDVVREQLPDGVRVLVVSKGDDALLDLPARQAWHFPRMPDGVYAGFNPGDDSAAIGHLESLRGDGADFLVFPATSFWWFEHYPDFKGHLDRRYRKLPCPGEVCVIYGLREPAAVAAPTIWDLLEQALSEYENRFERSPALLDWNTGLNLAERFPERCVFSPPSADARLPYLDVSVDVVALASEDPQAIAEARRIATGAVFIVRRPGGEQDAGAHLLEVELRTPADGCMVPAVSILIHCRSTRPTESWWRDLRASLPTRERAELLLVHEDGGETLPWYGCLEGSGLTRAVACGGTDRIGSLNRGAELAGGEIIVFVDTGVMLFSDWLPALLRTFRDHADAGAATGKLLGWQGDLREAGRAISLDGSLVPIGSSAYRPDAPEFSYVRRVDSCSSVLFATRRSLFLDAGGLDPRYHSADYAMAHYCMMLREKGYRVYYQPDCTAVRPREDEAIGDSATASRALFVEAWRHALNAAGPEAEQAESTCASIPG